MTKEMSDPNGRELNLENYSAKAIDVMLAPEKGGPQIYKTASDYINARAKQFSQNSYTGGLIQTRNEELALSLKTVRGTHTQVGTFTELPKLNINETWRQPAQVQIALMLEAAARYKAQGDIKKAGITTKEAEKLVQNYSSLKTNAKIRSGIAAVSLALAACSQPLVTQIPVSTQSAETEQVEVDQFPLTSDKAQEIINSEWGVGTKVVDSGKEFTIDSVNIDVENTYSELNSNQQIVNPSIIRTGHIAHLMAADGDEMRMPLLIEYDLASGRNRIFALAQNPDAQNQFLFVTHYQGKIVRTELMLQTKLDDDGGVFLQIINTDTGKITPLALTPKDGSPATEEVPTSVPADSNQWIDRLVGFITGAETAYAAEEVAATATATETSASAATAEQTATSILVPSEQPSTTPTPEGQEGVMNLESMTFLNLEDRLNGVLEMDEAGSAQMYSEILNSWLLSGVNDEYFATNFGIEDPTDPTAIDAFLQKLRENNYIMPAGLKLPTGKNDAILVEIEEWEEFKADTVLTQILSPDVYVQKRLDNVIRNSEVHDLGGAVYGVIKEMSPDGFIRMKLLLADSQKGPLGVSNADPAKPDTLKLVNRLLELYPHLFRNSRNARNPQGNETFTMDIANYLNHDTSSTVIDGDYRWNDSPDIATFKFSSN